MAAFGLNNFAQMPLVITISAAQISTSEFVFSPIDGT